MNKISDDFDDLMPFYGRLTQEQNQAFLEALDAEQQGKRPRRWSWDIITQATSDKPRKKDGHFAKKTQREREASAKAKKLDDEVKKQIAALEKATRDRQAKLAADQIYIRKMQERAKCFKQITIRDIIRIVAALRGLEPRYLISPSRKESVVLARQIAIYLCRRLTKRSTLEIGRQFGGRDHTTILYSRNKIAELIKTDEALAAEIRSLIALIDQKGMK